MDTPTKKRARATLEFITSAKRKKNAIKEQLNVELLQTLLEDFISKEDPNAERYYEKFLELFANALTRKPFSALSMIPSDQELVGLTITKGITFPELKPVTPSNSFDETIKKIGAYWNLRSEAGRRTLIDAYLLEALSLVGNPFLTVFTEHSIDATLENNTKLSGQLDYITALPVEKSSVKRHQEALSEGAVTALKPFFTVVEAKKEETFGEAQTQMLGEIAALCIENSGPANGVLTDGQRWRFYHVNPKVKETYFVSKKFLHGEQTGVILAILCAWMKGEVPPETQFED